MIKCFLIELENYDWIWCKWDIACGTKCGIKYTVITPDKLQWTNRNDVMARELYRRVDSRRKPTVLFIHCALCDFVHIRDVTKPLGVALFAMYTVCVHICMTIPCAEQSITQAMQQIEENVHTNFAFPTIDRSTNRPADRQTLIHLQNRKLFNNFKTCNHKRIDSLAQRSALISWIFHWFASKTWNQCWKTKQNKNIKRQKKSYYEITNKCCID